MNKQITQVCTASNPMIITYHTYADLVHAGDRLAATQWGGRHGIAAGTLQDGVAATLRLDPQAVILRAVRGDERVRGLAPGGLAA
jgi:hypothetical protein